MPTCPCGSNNEFSLCCEAIHNKKKMALSAEELMRSRYSAFAKADGEYLYHSHYRKTRPSLKEMKDTALWSKSVTWLKLDVISTTDGGLSDIEGTVYFKAFFMENGRTEVIEENSYFRKENGEWYYVGIVN